MAQVASKRFHTLLNKSVLVLACATTACLALADAASAEGLESYRLATGYYQRAKWALSVDEFRTFLKDLPDHPKAEKAEVFLGMALVNLKEFKQAREVFRSFIAKHQDSRYLSHAMYRVGECSFLLDDYQSADGELEQFLQKFPNDPLATRATYNRAEAQLALAKPAEAIELYNTVAANKVDKALANQAKFGLAKAYGQLQKMDEAEAIYAELSRDLTGEAAAEARMLLADLYFDQNNHAKAATAYAAVVEEFPDSPLVADAQLKLGKSLFGTGDYRQAADVLSHLADNEKLSADASFWQGASLKSAGQYAKAAEVFAVNYAQLSDAPEAARTLYHWADTEQRLNQTDKSVAHYLELIRRWPEHALSDDALHAAALAALKGNKHSQAEELIARFTQEFPTSGLRYRQRLVQGRINLALAKTGDPKQTAERFAAAEQEFRTVMQESEIETTQLRARYFLAYTMYELGKYQQALEVIAPLTAQLNKNPTDTAYVDAYVLDALCHLKLKEYGPAGTSVSAYLKMLPEGEFVSQALGIRARAAAHLGDKATAVADHTQLKSRWPHSVDFARTTEELANIAYDNSDFPWAAELFELLSVMDKDSKYRPIGLSGLGWSQYQQKQYDLSADSFATFVTDYPEHSLAAESGFKHGASLRELGKIEEAAQVFKNVFQAYAPSDKAFVAGLAAARQLRASQRIDDADAMYAALTKKYPQRDDMDKLLNEWTVMLHAAKHYERSDAICRRIVAEHLDSPLANDARLQLAISDLIAGKLAEARPAFQQLESNPKLTDKIREEALFRLIAINVIEEHWKAAQELSERSLTDFPQGKHQWDARFRAAQAYYELRQFDKARTALDELRKARTEPALADGESTEGETVEKLDWFPSVWLLLAEIHLQEKRYDDVAATVAEFRAASPKSPYLYQADEVLGRSLNNQAKFDEAREAFRRVTESESGQKTETAAKSQFILANTYFHQKDYEQAIAELLKVDILYDFPEYQSASLLSVGMCEEKLNRWDKAAEAYEDLLKRFPESKHAESAKARLADARLKASR
ncbi:tol-pal system protein YbgF [Symmachiella macrocystis]|uniref:Tol-pal system protein YbgF n=1 Tax=Symmachiella macrocystis TaxID=2527985 RepID=A0A5C6B4F4_9PLAN|nr:tetratricopeptide repeat protein [Symmachiella macrocystis]TWU06800.1 tol-pal system protein YbgF [Symmachiella macrocystis]